MTPDDFNAASGGADDTIPLRNWLAADGTHEVGDKTYVIRPQGDPGPILPLTTKRVITGHGGGCIKIADNSGGYYSIIGSNSTLDDLSGTVIDGVNFDHNSAGNSFTASGSTLTHPHFTFSAHKGDRIRFKNCEVNNAVCTNSLFINGDSGTGICLVSNVTVKDNEWYNVGGSPVEHDHSTIYVVSRGMRIKDNYGEGASLGATGTKAFIETHGTRQRVRDNDCLNFVGLANITGVDDAGCTESSFITGNTGEVQEHGIRLYSAAYGTNTSGYGIRSLVASNNVIRIHQSTLTGPRTCIGVGFLQGATLPVCGVDIINNVIEYDLETEAPAYTGLSCAIGANETTDPDPEWIEPEYASIRIEGNTIINAPAMAIGMGIGGGIMKNWRIGPNTIINPGQGKSPAIQPAQRVAIWGNPNKFTGSLIVEKQSITDEHDITRMVYAAFLLPAIDSTVILCRMDFDIALAGNGLSYISPVQNVSSRLRPIVTARQNKAFVSTGHIFAAGSEVYDTVNNLRHQIFRQGNIWNSIGYVTAVPTGPGFIGDIRIHASPAAGGWGGFRYTPAAWKGFAEVDQ